MSGLANRRGPHFILLLVLLCGVPLDKARAQTVENKAAAEALFDEARRLLKEGNYAQACPKFRDSQELDPGVGTLLNLALCYKQAGRLASAWGTYREAAAEARTQGQTEREELARTEAAGLEVRLTRLRLVLPPEAKEIDGLELLHNGDSLVQSLWEMPIPVDAGEHLIEARAPGTETSRITVQASGEGKTLDVPVPLPKPSAVAVPASPAPPPAATPPLSATAEPAEGEATSSRGSSTLGLVVLGIGAVGLGAGTYFALQTKSNNDDALAICPNYPVGPCSDSDVSTHSNLVNDAKTDRTLAYVGFGVGAAGAVLGTVFLLTSGSGPAETASSSWAIVPSMGASAWGVEAKSSW